MWFLEREKNEIRFERVIHATRQTHLDDNESEHAVGSRVAQMFSRCVIKNQCNRCKISALCKMVSKASWTSKRGEWYEMHNHMDANNCIGAHCHWSRYWSLVQIIPEGDVWILLFTRPNIRMQSASNRNKRPFNHIQLHRRPTFSQTIFAFAYLASNLLSKQVVRFHHSAPLRRVQFMLPANIAFILSYTTLAWRHSWLLWVLKAARTYITGCRLSFELSCNLKLATFGMTVVHHKSNKSKPDRPK